jgi:hypothetical protein
MAVAYYAVRRIFVAPASPDARCFMGSPIGEFVHCPRRAMGQSPWCRRHDPKDAEQ